MTASVELIFALPLMAEYNGWNDGSDQKISGVSKILLTKLTLILMMNSWPIFFVIAVLQQKKSSVS